jgi:methionyl-tRNA synthetase
VDPVELVSKYGIDPMQFFLMSEVTFGSDGDFLDDRMVHKVNANLSNKLGNLNQRIMTLVYKNYDGATPTKIWTFTAEDEAMLATARLLHSWTGEAMLTQLIHRYIQHMISAVWDANRYIDA